MSEDEFWDWVLDSPADVGREVLRLAKLLSDWYRVAPGNPASWAAIESVVDEYREIV